MEDPTTGKDGEWSPYKEEIKLLFLIERKTTAEILKHLKETYGFCKT